MDTARKTAIACSVIVAFFASIYFLYLAQTILLYVGVALLLAVAINPVVNKLKRLKINRVLASLLSILLLVVIIGGIVAAIVVPLAKQGVGFAQNLPIYTQNLLTNPTFQSLDQKYHLLEYISEFSNHASTILLGQRMRIVSFATGTILAISATTIILVLTFLFLIEGERIWKGILSLLNEKNASIVDRVGGKISKAILGFVSGNLLTSLIAGIVAFVTLWILGVPYKFSLAALVGLFGLIPFVGVATATIVVALVALTKSAFAAVVVVVVILIYQFLEGHIIAPLVYSRSVDLSAIFIVIASLVGAEIAGIAGVLLAIPIAAVLQILVIEIYEFFSTRTT